MPYRTFPLAYVPEKDVNMLWDAMGDNKSWGGLKDALQKHPEVGNVLDKNMADKLRMVADRMKSYQFPDSPDALAEVLSQRLATWDDDILTLHSKTAQQGV